MSRYLILFLGAPCLAQMGTDPFFGSSNHDNAHLESEYQEGEGDDSIDSEELDLAMASHEVRNLYKSSIGLGVGHYEAWQMIGIRGQWFSTRDLHVDISLGGGSWSFDDRLKSKKYEIDVVSKGIAGGLRYFFTEFTPIHVYGGLGYDFLHGGIQPTGLGAEDTSNLRSGFQAHGAHISTRLGWQKAWRSGLYVDIVLFGMAYHALLNKDLTRDGADSREALDKTLTGPISWGMVNISSGLYL